MTHSKQTLIDFHRAWLREMYSKGITKDGNISLDMIKYCLFILEDELE